MIDPFLLLDVFRSDEPQDYIAGFPPHPHRGFETVTYLLEGRMRHKDNAGHEGVIEPGGIQWMTAGKGIIHSEMPEQEKGMLEGFQLWVNLPASHKMTEPAYQEIPASGIPVEIRDNDISVKVIAGKTSRGTCGPVTQPLTEPVYMDVSLPAGGTFSEALPASHNAFIYVVKGQVEIVADDRQTVKQDQLARLSNDDIDTVICADDAARILLIAGKPLNEPVARGGPFVMNHRAEIDQAFADYKSGNF